MATITAFDNINKLNDAEERRYDEYFGEMRISAQQRRKRVELAEILEDIVLFLFALYVAARTLGEDVDRKAAEKEYRRQLEDALAKQNIYPEVMEAYFSDVVPEEIRVTDDRYMDDEYWTSEKRAKVIASEDANTIMNAQEYQTSVDAGFKNKQWLSMKDERVRPTHVEVDDEVMPIDEPFVVGSSLMMFPRDTSLGASADEIVNCRCSTVYF